MSAEKDTIVIGGGPAGLTAAYTLAKHGVPVTVLEKDPEYVGGISRTVNYKGYLFDIGGHRFFSKSREIVDLWQEILPDDFIERPRLSRIYYRGRFYSYPLKAFEALRNLGVLEGALCLLSFAHAKFRPIAEPKSFHDWVRNQFGERLFGIFFKTYTEKVWGMGCDEISADWAAQRIKGLSLGAAVRDGFRRSLGVRRQQGSGIKTLIDSFHYPRKGPGMMWDAAARAIESMGGRILRGHETVGLEHDAAANNWRVKCRTSEGADVVLHAGNVVSSAPLRELAGMIEPAPNCLRQAERLRYRDFLTVVLIGPTGEEFPDNWIYIHDPSVKVGRVQNFRSWSPEMIPDPRMTCLGLEYFCFEGDGMWSAKDEDLIALAKSEIGKIGLMDPAAVTDAAVVRQSKAYPVYDGSYKEIVAGIRAELSERFPSLHVAGRNGMHKYNNQDHAMMTGMLTALNIIAGEQRYDTWAVNEDAEYTEAGVSGAQSALKSERLVPARIDETA